MTYRLARWWVAALGVTLAAAVPSAQYRTLDDHFPPPVAASKAAWDTRAAYLREHVLASAGLLPLPEKTPLRPEIFGEIRHDDYRVAKVYFESLPGFFVTGNLYRPTGSGPYPAILSPHGHWAYGRLENTDINSVPGRAINLARQGFVVFTYDAIGYNDSRQLTHTFDGRRERLWGLSLGGLQLWNSIRSVDFLETLPDVRRDAIGATGESGGGTQTFLLSAVDPRIQVAAPVNMISLQMQGGCLCENLPGLRLDATNVEIAATIAPRPLLMVAATGDWTRATLREEYPAMRRIYGLFDADARVEAVQFDAPHNYNRDSREAVYAWMARWLQHAPADTKRPERSFTADPPPDLLVFHGRTLPPGAVTAAQLTDQWIDAAKGQLASADRTVLQAGLRHALGFDAAPAAASKASSRTVLIAGSDPELEQLLTKAGLQPKRIAFTPFDPAAAAKIRHFETYNRTAAAQQVADIVAAARETPGAMLVATRDYGLAGVLASGLTPLSRAVLAVDGFDSSRDDDFLARLYVPGLRRAGDLTTAVSMASGPVVIHGAGNRFAVAGARIEARALTAAEIVAMLTGRAAAVSRSPEARR